MLLDVKEGLIGMMEEKGELAGPSDNPNPLNQQVETTVEKVMRDTLGSSFENFDDKSKKMMSKRVFEKSEVGFRLSSGELPPKPFLLFRIRCPRRRCRSE